MAYSIYPMEDVQSVFLLHTAELSAEELSAARTEAHAVLDQRGWNRLLVDVTLLRSVPTFLELRDYARNPDACPSRPLRVALLVRPGQERPAKLFEKTARHGRVFVTYFVDPDQAVAWLKQTIHRGPVRTTNRPAAERPRFSGLAFAPQLFSALRSLQSTIPLSHEH